MSARGLVAAVALSALCGAVATLVGVRACGVGSMLGTSAPGSAGAPSRQRGADLGPDAAEIAEIRVTLETGSVNGAGSDNPALLWIDNRRYTLSDEPSRDFAPGRTIATTLMGPGIPRTLGDLRRASIVLTLHLDRAEIGASWYCERAAIEVRMEGEERHRSYLDVRDVGWLSQDEPPRRSPAFALQ